MNTPVFSEITLLLYGGNEILLVASLETVADRILYEVVGRGEEEAEEAISDWLSEQDDLARGILDTLEDIQRVIDRITKIITIIKGVATLDVNAAVEGTRMGITATMKYEVYNNCEEMVSNEVTIEVDAYPRMVGDPANLTFVNDFQQIISHLHEHEFDAFAELNQKIEEKQTSIEEQFCP